MRPLLAPYFDYIVDKDPLLHGYLHKLHLDRYSPFQQTFYFDSDVLIFRRLDEVLPAWSSQPYTACGNYLASGTTAFGLDRQRVLNKIGATNLVHIDGAGHCYFRKPECHAVFDLARDIVANYQQYGLISIGTVQSALGDLRFADEDVMDIAMTIMNLKPMPHEEFFSRHCSGKNGSVVMKTEKAECQFISVTTGQLQRPHMMHFAMMEAPFAHALQLRRLFKAFNVSTRGLWRLATSDYLVTHLKWPLKHTSKSILMKLGLLDLTIRLARKFSDRAIY
jgi:hypothetical protein